VGWLWWRYTLRKQCSVRRWYHHGQCQHRLPKWLILGRRCSSANSGHHGRVAAASYHGLEGKNAAALPYFTPCGRETCQSFLMIFGVEKLWSYQAVEKALDRSSHLDTIQTLTHTDRQTDRQTDGHRMMAIAVLCSHASKNCTYSCASSTLSKLCKKQNCTFLWSQVCANGNYGCQTENRQQCFLTFAKKIVIYEKKGKS